jgi:hypothetical protein
LPTVTEKPESRRMMTGRSPSLDLEYVVEGYADQDTAAAALAAAAPSYWGNLVRVSYGVTPVGDGSRFWDGTVRYGPASRLPAAAPTGSRRISGRTGGGTEHLLLSIQNMGNYAASGETAPDFGGMIGVEGEGAGMSVRGCDVPVRGHAFSVAWMIPAAEVTAAYIGDCGLCTAHVNDDEWTLVTDYLTLTFAEGEAILDNVAWSQRSDDDWEFVYDFRVRANRASVTIPGSDIVEIPLVRGWEYLWVHSMPVKDDSAKMTVMRPKSAHVEQVIYGNDFSLLKLHE